MPEPVIITVEGLDALIRRMDEAPTLVRRLAGDAIEKSVHVIHREVAKYPPPPPGSTYRRTGTLGRSFTTRVNRRKFFGEVGTRLEYAGYVIGERQAAVHKGRWTTVEQVAAKLRPKIVKFFEEANEQLTKELAK